MISLYENELTPNQLRINILKMAKAGGTGHIGPSFSLVEIIIALYKNFIKLDWNNKNNLNRDVLALSKGHGVMALYAVFKEFGWLSEEQLLGYMNSNNHLKGLSSTMVSGIEVSGGSLGHGLPVSVGIAYAQRVQDLKSRTFCIVGDGELNEGSVWESVLFAAHNKLDNLIVIVDSNKYQAMGRIEDIINLENLIKRFKTFGFNVKQCNGHNIKSISNSLKFLINKKNKKPGILIANTIKGKGVSFMENDNIWHYSRLTDELFQKAFSELRNA